MSLQAVRRVYASGGPPVTTWNLDATPLPTIGFNFTRRMGQASSASFKLAGATCPLAISDRIFAYGNTADFALTPAGGWNSTDETLTVTDYAKLPLQNFVIKVEDEYIYVTSRSGGTLTCTGGREWCGSTADTHPESEPVWLVWTWGGVVYGVNQTKKGFEIGCLDFISSLESIPVTHVFPDAVSGYDDDVHILEHLLTLQQTPHPNLHLLNLTAADTPIGYMNLVKKPLLSILNEMCEMLGHSYYCTQSWWDQEPKLVYLHPPASASGVALTSSDIANDWNVSSDHSQLVNDLDVTATIDPIPEDNAWVKHNSGQRRWGVTVGTVTTSYRPVGKTADNRLGVRFSVQDTDATVPYFYIRVKKVETNPGDLTGDLKILHRNPDESEDAAAILVAHDNANLAATMYTFFVNTLSFDCHVGDNYFEIFTDDIDSDTHYYDVAIIYAQPTPTENNGNPASGLLSSLRMAGDHVWSSGANSMGNAAEYLWFCFYDNGANSTSWHSASTDEFTDNGENLFVKHTGGSDYLNYIDVYPALACDSRDYQWLKISIASCVPNHIHLIVGSSTTTYAHRILTTDNEGTVAYIPLGATAAGWTASGAINWDAISLVGFYTTAAMHLLIKDLTFLNEKATNEYIESVANTNSKVLYDHHFFSKPVTFQHKPDIDAYAAAYLAKYKDPIRSISVRAVTTRDVSLGYTLTVTLGGVAYTPQVIGADVDPVRNRTKFIFDAFGQNNLLAALGKALQI